MPKTEDLLLIARAAIRTLESDVSGLRTLLAAAKARAARMEAALTVARDKFAEYCSLHLEKGTPEATAKAMANRRLASMCATALAADPSALAQAIEGVLADDDLYKAALRRHQSEDVANDLCGRLDALRREWGQR